MRLQPGVLRILDLLPEKVNILDLGCGNGSLAMELIKRKFSGYYSGHDFSKELLHIANINIAASDKYCQPNRMETSAKSSIPHKHTFQNHTTLEELEVSFHQTDISRHDWDKNLQRDKYNNIFAFAVLHHIPGESLRIDVLKKVRALLKTDSTKGENISFIFSVWQFLNSDRLSKRIQPWEICGLDKSDVDHGDYLLDWRRGGRGYRYIHHFTQEELGSLADKTGFDILQAFLSDGENNRLGLYQIWSVK